MVSEAQVVYSLKKHLCARGLEGSRISDIVIDADPSYRASKYARDLEPMAMIRIEGFRPDVVCSLEESKYGATIAFEVKAKWADWPKGLAQARLYRSGAHFTYLALPASEAAKDAKQRVLEQEARESGVGVLVRNERGWCEIVPPADPRPAPWNLEPVKRILRGASAARCLQLNHPLNYLVVPYFRYRFEAPLEDVLERFWKDLKTANSRQYAILGARYLGLIDGNSCLTTEGVIVAELLTAVGFDPSRRINKRKRLCETAPAVSIGARMALSRQPAVRLIVETLKEVREFRHDTAELFQKAQEKDEMLARSLFLSDPGLQNTKSLRSVDFKSTTIYQFKQMLWHAGILARKAHPTAGKGVCAYAFKDDIWELEERFKSKIACNKSWLPVARFLDSWGL